MKIAFIIAHTGNNVVVLFGTLKVQSFMLTEVKDCDLLIVVCVLLCFIKPILGNRHIFYFSEKKRHVKRKKQFAQIITTRSTAYI